MKESLILIIRFALRLVLAFRYRVRLQVVPPIWNPHKPTVLLCNHPAYIDPVIVYAFLPTKQKIRPLVYYGAFRAPFLSRVFDLIGAIEIVDFTSSKTEREHNLDQLLLKITQSLRGEIVLIHPSGRLQRDGREIIGGARVVYELLRLQPDVQVVMVHSMGLWGSCFSCAENGTLPDLRRSVAKSLACFLLNYGVFAPKRNVLIRIGTKQITEFDLSSRFALNADLEAWFENSSEKFPEFVPYFFWGKKTRIRNANSQVVTITDVPARVVIEANQYVVNYVGANLGIVINMDGLEANTIIASLGLDSLDVADFESMLEEHLGLTIGSSPKCMEDVWRLFNSPRQAV